MHNVFEFTQPASVLRSFGLGTPITQFPVLVLPAAGGVAYKKKLPPRTYELPLGKGID